MRAIIDLADALKLRVVAEGVEDRATWDVLAGLGCELAQGYFLSRPADAVGLEAWIADTGQSWLDVAEQSRGDDALQGLGQGRESHRPGSTCYFDADHDGEIYPSDIAEAAKFYAPGQRIAPTEPTAAPPERSFAARLADSISGITLICAILALAFGALPTSSGDAAFRDSSLEGLKTSRRSASNGKGLGR